MPSIFIPVIRQADICAPDRFELVSLRPVKLTSSIDQPDMLLSVNEAPERLILLKRVPAKLTLLNAVPYKLTSSKVEPERVALVAFKTSIRSLICMLNASKLHHEWEIAQPSVDLQA